MQSKIVRRGRGKAEVGVEDKVDIVLLLFYLFQKSRREERGERNGERERVKRSGLKRKGERGKGKGGCGS